MPLCWGLLHALQEIWFIHLVYCWQWLEHSPECSPENWFLTIYDSPPWVPHSSVTFQQINLRQTLTAPCIALHINSHYLFTRPRLFLYLGFKPSTVHLSSVRVHSGRLKLEQHPRWDLKRGPVKVALVKVMHRRFHFHTVNQILPPFSFLAESSP